LKKFPNYIQPDNKDCGPTCLKIIAKHYGKIINLQHLRDISETQREGSSLLNLSDASELIGLRSVGVKINLEKLKDTPLPCILHWNKNHYVVLYKIQRGYFYVSDPAHGLLKYNKADFLKYWIGNN
jgi:ATP-binding cassette subfamily B protein